MTTSSSRAWTLGALTLLGACGTDPAAPELVIRDATMGMGSPVVLGASADSVYWSVGSGNGPRLAAGGSLASLPAAGQPLGMASGSIAQVADHVLLVNDSSIVRASVAVPATKVANVPAESLTESDEAAPILVWSEGAKVSWGDGEALGTATLTKILHCDQLVITGSSIFVGATGTSEDRLLRIDRATSTVFPLSASSTHAMSFPGGGATGASYRGRLVGADAVGAAWLVEEVPAGATAASRTILVSYPAQGEPSVALEHIGASSAFFVDADAFYWQEGEVLLTAPRAGGAASILGHLPATAGAIEAGFVYYTKDGSILRLPLDGLD
ncbi:MAG: hypothetical protein IPQ07_12970 [Myxococcales bacterium]|nr:hypothetical protein [Myxococcales bacterium]